PGGARGRRRGAHRHPGHPGASGHEQRGVGDGHARAARPVRPAEEDLAVAVAVLVPDQPREAVPVPVRPGGHRDVRVEQAEHPAAGDRGAEEDPRPAPELLPGVADLRDDQVVGPVAIYVAAALAGRDHAGEV
ncbi:MAG: hypothetical protein ACK559_23645, partial [bacterium]